MVSRNIKLFLCCDAVMPGLFLAGGLGMCEHEKAGSRKIFFKICTYILVPSFAYYLASNLTVGPLKKIKKDFLGL